MHPDYILMFPPRMVQKRCFIKINLPTGAPEGETIVQGEAVDGAIFFKQHIEQFWIKLVLFNFFYHYLWESLSNKLPDFHVFPSYHHFIPFFRFLHF